MPTSNLRGLVLMALGFFCFAVSDTAVKFLAEDLSPIQIVWTRQAGLVAVVIGLMILRGAAVLKSARAGLQLTRGAVAVVAPLAMAFAFSFIPLADAIAVTFLAPFFVTILGAFYLKEPVNLQRWVATIVGFAGALVIIRPGMGVVQPAIALVVIAAAFFALRQVLSRPLASTDNTQTTLAYTALTSFALMTLPLPFFWNSPASLETIFLLVGMATMAALGEILIIRAFEIAEAVVVAPVHYTLIIWATLFGWLVFDQLPDFWTWVGMSIIVAAGIYVVQMDRASTRRAHDALTPPD